MTRGESTDHPQYVEALSDLREEVESEPVEQTRLAELYEEASTARVDMWNTVTAFMDIEDGEATVTDVSKLAAGRWAPEILDDCDTLLTVDVQRGVTDEQFKATVHKKLTTKIDQAADIDEE